MIPSTANSAIRLLIASSWAGLRPISDPAAVDKFPRKSFLDALPAAVCSNSPPESSTKPEVPARFAISSSAVPNAPGVGAGSDAGSGSKRPFLNFSTAVVASPSSLLRLF